MPDFPAFFMPMKKTLVLGASPNPNRSAYMAAERLVENGTDVLPVGIKKGEISGIGIMTGKPEISGIHTITLYLNAENQREYYDYIFGLKPKRIIFNPGAENDELVVLAKKAGIETIYGCTLTMLALGNY